MLERFTAIDATMSRVREQAVPLVLGVRELAADTPGR